MYRRIGLLLLILLVLSACSSELYTKNLEIEQEGTNTIYVPVDKETAEEALPFEIKYPTYFPFENEETKMFITSWEKSKEKIVTSIRYPSIEEDAKWQHGSITQAAIPNVNFTVANFDRYYSTYSKITEYKKIKIADGLTGFYKINKQLNGAELHWFTDGKEYNLQLIYYSEDNDRLKEELIKIANSI